MIGILYIDGYWYLAEKQSVGGQLAWLVMECPLNGFPCYNDAVSYRKDQYGIG